MNHEEPKEFVDAVCEKIAGYHRKENIFYKLWRYRDELRSQIKNDNQPTAEEVYSELCEIIGDEE